jgi:LemA protein
MRGFPAAAKFTGVECMVALVILVFILVALVSYAVVLYNGLLRVAAGVKLAWSNIDVLLVQRHDELPKLVEVCRQYMQFEGDTLERVIKARSAADSARSSGSVSSVGAAERELRSGLNGLYAVAERYPDLKANEAFRQLQSRISGLETAIADRREIYNDSVNANNIRIQTFPDVLVAQFGNFPAAKLLQFQTEEKADVDVKALFAR